MGDEDDCFVVYTEAFYFASLSITSVGYGDLLVTPLERGINAIVLLLSQLFLAKVLRPTRCFPKPRIYPHPSPIPRSPQGPARYRLFFSTFAP
eukprot:1889516-Amphidinium_carterae.1